MDSHTRGGEGGRMVRESDLNPLMISNVLYIYKCYYLVYWCVFEVISILIYVETRVFCCQELVEIDVGGAVFREIDEIKQRSS